MRKNFLEIIHSVLGFLFVLKDRVRT